MVANEGRPLANDHSEGPYDGIGNYSSWMKIAFFLCKIRFRAHMGSGQAERKRFTFSLAVKYSFFSPCSESEDILIWVQLLNVPKLQILPQGETSLSQMET